MTAPPERSGLLTFGETMGLVTASGIGTLEFVRNCRFTIGGAESNVAIGAARLGVPVTWIGRVGNDATGDLIERRLRAEQLDAVVIRDEAFTGLMVRHSRTGTSHHVDYHRTGSAGSHLTAADVAEGRVRGAEVLHVTGITPALSESARRAVQHAIEVARAAGVVVSLDINYRSKLWTADTARPVLSHLVASADIVFGGVAEAQLVLNIDHRDIDHRDIGHTDVERLARGLAALGPGEAVIKDGARGCTAVLDDVVAVEPAIPVAVVDPVGAGDAFVAGYLAERLAGGDFTQRLRTATAMGAYAVTVPGDCELLPTRAELQALAGAEDVSR